MQTIQTTKSSQSNPLRSLLEGFAGSAAKFREKVCDECGWSESTFYKKVRETRNSTEVFSKAEIERIKDLAWEIQQELKDRL